MSTGRRVKLAVIGIFALVSWSGFFMGPVLVILTAVVPPYTVIKKQMALEKAFTNPGQGYICFLLYLKASI